MWLITRLIQTDVSFFFSLVATTVEPRIRIVHMGERQSWSAYYSFHLLVFTFIFSNPQLCSQSFLISECLFQTAQHTWPLFLPTSQSWLNLMGSPRTSTVFFEKGLSRTISVIVFLELDSQEISSLFGKFFAILSAAKKWRECSFLPFRSAFTVSISWRW